MQPIALIDMDGTIADIEKSLMIDGQNETGMKLPKDLRKLLFKKEGFWLDLPIMEDGIKLLSFIKEVGFRINILTKGPVSTENAWTEKLQWCKRHLTSILGTMQTDYDLTITTNKCLVHGDILVDDFPPYCDGWSENHPNGLVIQPKRDYNEYYVKPNVLKYSEENFDEVCQAIYKVKNNEIFRL